MAFFKYTLFLFFLLSPDFQGQNAVRLVLHTFPDGKAKMIVWYIPGTQEIVREEAHFSNGNLDYTGTYSGDLEEGAWTFYWENGQVKTEGRYEKGLEEGLHKDYDQSGRLIKETNYLHGTARSVRAY